MTSHINGALSLVALIHKSAAISAEPMQTGEEAHNTSTDRTAELAENGVAVLQNWQ
jgi:hypothetical protein